MSGNYYLAVDIGASSGRHILGCVDSGRILLEEIYRFPNGMQKIDGKLCWDTKSLFDEIIKGMKVCAGMGKVPHSAGIDTWGVDFVLLDSAGHLTAPAVGYRDSRTDGMPAQVFERIPKPELYAHTGIQDVIFNTIYQLMAVKLKTPQYFDNAEHLLLMPDYLHYMLCGVMATEYTIASTTGLVNASSKTWDDEVIAKCGFKRKLFRDITAPGTQLGTLTDEVASAVGYKCKVVLPPSHDTGSAFLAAPARNGDLTGESKQTDRCVFISSGTWSIMGVELAVPITTQESLSANFSNEGGYDYRYRYVKNIMGLWMIQSVRRELDNRYDYEQLAKLAGDSVYLHTVDVDDKRFFAPGNMTYAIREVCRDNGYKTPETPGDLALCIYQSLALSYSKTINELEKLTQSKYDSINIFGGGSQNELLNKLTAQKCDIPVFAGPTEATALGNIISQMIASGELQGVQDARRMIRDSFDIKQFTG